MKFGIIWPENVLDVTSLEIKLDFAQLFVHLHFSLIVLQHVPVSKTVDMVLAGQGEQPLGIVMP